MSYVKRLLERERQVGHPVRVGVVGAGQMGSGLIAQIERAKGMEVAAVADIAPSAVWTPTPRPVGRTSWWSPMSPRPPNWSRPAPRW